jgi:hypothetical protein
MSCNSCQMIAINGIACHETGCPDAWRTIVAECKWCGQGFYPETKWQECCCHTCFTAYANVPCNCEECAGEEVAS